MNAIINFFLIFISLVLSLYGCDAPDTNNNHFDYHMGTLTEGKAPYEYTWEEFEKLSPAQQMRFQSSFESPAEFDEWMDKAKTEATVYPWEKEGAKQPSEYTLKEFQALSGEQQMAFQNSFKSSAEFEKWLNKAEEKATVYPWEKKGAKQPSEYTLKEFQALSGEQQMAFQNSFECFDEFEKWMNEAEAEGIVYSWEKKGAKQPSEYTWKEFQALSGEEQMAFQNSFEDFDDFMKWLSANRK